MSTPSVMLGAFLTLLPTLPLLGAPPKKSETARVDSYGDPLPPGAVARLGTVRLRHSHCMAFSLDGKLLATAGHKFIRLWETATGKEVRRAPLPESLETVLHVTFSPDGRKIAAV